MFSEETQQIDHVRGPAAGKLPFYPRKVKGTRDPEGRKGGDDGWEAKVHTSEGGKTAKDDDLSRKDFGTETNRSKGRESG